MIDRLERTEHTVALPHLPAALAGLRVVQLTDLHRSRHTSDRLLRAAVAQCVAWRPDIILLTGDFVNHDPADIAPCMEILAPLAPRTTGGSIAPLGVYAVPGNHDRRAGLEQVQAGLAGLGITFLLNSSVRLDNGLALVGIDEDWHGTPDVELAFAGIPPDAPTLALAHNPGTADLMADRECLIFSGHTHGGQVNVPFLTAHVVRWIKAKHYRAGWYTVGRAQLYVNRGLGNADLPIRFRCRPEIALFTLSPSPPQPVASQPPTRGEGG